MRTVTQMAPPHCSLTCEGSCTSRYLYTAGFYLKFLSEATHAFNEQKQRGLVDHILEPCVMDNMSNQNLFLELHKNCVTILSLQDLSQTAFVWCIVNFEKDGVLEFFIWHSDKLAGKVSRPIEHLLFSSFISLTIAAFHFLRRGMSFMKHGKSYEDHIFAVFTRQDSLLCAISL